MKPIKAIFDNNRRHFEIGGKLERWYPLFDATETFFFMPSEVTHTGPHVRDSLDLKRLMSIVIIALMPVLAFSIYNTGLQSNVASGGPLDLMSVILKGLVIVLPMFIVSYGVGLFWEVLFAVIRRHKISEGFFVTGFLFPLTLPPTTPWWQMAVGISFGVIIGKEIFGGTGRNFLNPALTARAFMFFAYPAQMSGDQVWTVITTGSKTAVDAITSATPLAILSSAPLGSQAESLLREANYTWERLFWGIYPGSVGETSTMLCLLGALIMIGAGVASYRIIIGGVAGVLVTGSALNLLAPAFNSPWMALNPVYHLLIGSFAFGITYMATDPVSGPGLNRSKWVYGFLIGMLTILIRVFNPAFPEGVMLSILFMNVFAPLLDHIEIKLHQQKRGRHVRIS